MTRTLLIVGAGRWQMYLIAKARASGYRIVAVDADVAAPGFRLSDLPIVCDIRDPNKVLDRVKNLRIDGVLSDQTEISLKTVSSVAEKLGLPHTKTDVIERATNKGEMRRVWKDGGVPVPSFTTIQTKEEMESFVRLNGFPVISKPLKASGSMGVWVSRQEEDVKRAFDFAQESSGPGPMIVESYLEGREYTVEAFSIAGKTQILAISQKTKPDSHFQVATLLEYPPDLPLATIDQIKQIIERAVGVLGITDGPSHSEILLTKSGPVMVETAARGGGFRISSDIITLVSGFDQLEALINLSLGEKIVSEKKYEHAATLGFFYPKPGAVKAIHGVDLAHRIETLHSFELFVSVGIAVGELRSDRSRAGYFILASPSVEKVREDTKRIYESVQIVTGS